MIPALELAGISKRFGAVAALANVDFRVRPASVHALLGENGAGKTTLMRVATGLLTPDAGVVRVSERALKPGSASDAIDAGVWMMQQHFTLAPALSVFENVAVGLTPRPALRIALRHATELAGLRLDLDTPVSTLGVPDQQRVELLKAVTRGSRVLILDEPTASLAPVDVEGLFRWVREFRERGGSVVVITHKLREALSIADEVSVIRKGAITWQGPRSATSESELVSAMVGEPDRSPVPPTRAARPTDDPVVAAEDVSVRDRRGVARVGAVSFDVHGGEVLGVAGVEGSGYRELLFAVAGRLPPASGRLRLPDEPHIAFIPDDRHRDALLLDESIVDNVLLKGAGTRRGWLRRRPSELKAARVIQHSGIPNRNVRQRVRTLSGGNQQRLVLARELADGPRLIVALNPCRGLDVGAAAAMQRQLHDAARAGCAVVVHTPDLDELVALSHRVVVMFGGRLTVVERDRSAIGRAMVGVA